MGESLTDQLFIFSFIINIIEHFLNFVE